MSARPTRRPTARKTRRLLAGLTTAAVALVAPAVLAPAAHADTAADLFISEYVEGSSNNKALEIFNGTGGSIDLAAGGYVVQVTDGRYSDIRLYRSRTGRYQPQ